MLPDMKVKVCTYCGYGYVICANYVPVWAVCYKDSAKPCRNETFVARYLYELRNEA